MASRRPDSGVENPFRVPGLYANALLQAGRTSDAVELLRECAKFRGEPVFAYQWLGVQLTLIELYQRLGRHDDASILLPELRTLLGAAEPDWPLLSRLVRAKARSRAADAIP